MLAHSFPFRHGQCPLDLRSSCSKLQCSFDKTFEALSELINAHTLQLSRKKEAITPAAMVAGRQGRQDGSREYWNCEEKGLLSAKCLKQKIGEGRNYRPKARALATAQSESGNDTSIVYVTALISDDSLIGAVARVSCGIGEHDTLLAAVQQQLHGNIL